jgi:Zn-dependent membrane protease YugP
MKMLEEQGMLRTSDDRGGAQAVLRAAAFTYLAAMIGSILNLLYYAMLVSGMNRRD